MSRQPWILCERGYYHIGTIIRAKQGPNYKLHGEPDTSANQGPNYKPHREPDTSANRCRVC